MNTDIANSSMIYDVILVVVIGGVGLSGGHGGVRNVVVGTLLIGILLNGMTIMNIEYTLQNVIRSLILLVAIVLDSIVNPRDEQTRNRAISKPPVANKEEDGNDKRTMAAGGQPSHWRSSGMTTYAAAAGMDDLGAPITSRRSKARRSHSCRARWAST